jgi:hypothetical protein
MNKNQSSMPNPFSTEEKISSQSGINPKKIIVRIVSKIKEDQETL